MYDGPRGWDGYVDQFDDLKEARKCAKRSISSGSIYQFWQIVDTEKMCVVAEFYA